MESDGDPGPAFYFVVVYAVVGAFDAFESSSPQVQKETLVISMLAEAVLLSRTAAEGCTSTFFSKFDNKILGLCCSLIITVDKAPDLAVTVLMQTKFLDVFPGCL